MKKLIPKNKQKLYCIEWVDAYTNAGWHNKEDIEKMVNGGGFVAEAAGWIVFEDKDAVHLVAGRSINNNSYADYTIIPKAWIFKKRVLK